MKHEVDLQQDRKMKGSVGPRGSHRPHASIPKKGKPKKDSLTKRKRKGLPSKSSVRWRGNAEELKGNPHYATTLRQWEANPMFRTAIVNLLPKKATRQGARRGGGEMGKKND